MTIAKTTVGSQDYISSSVNENKMKSKSQFATTFQKA
jgi:hypothetical protein